MAEKVSPHQHNHKALKWSVVLSFLCLIHCISFPLLVALLPFANIAFNPPEWIEGILILSTLFLGLFSLWHGYKLHHHSKTPVFWFLFGITGTITTHIFQPHQKAIFPIALSILFGLMVAYSQYKNYSLSNSIACTTKH